MVWKISYFFAPFIAMILGSILINIIILNKIESRELKVTVSMVLGLILFFALLKLVSFLARKAQISPPMYGGVKAGIAGIILGLIISFVSGFLFSKNKATAIDWSTFRRQAPYSTIASVSPATIEEATFRFGIVHGAAFLWGTAIGYLAGSVPFGLGHLIDRLTGKIVSIEQVIGIILAGLLLSVLYLKFGLWAAVGCHWVWNSLAGPWVKALHLNSSSGMADFEGAYTTSVVLVVTIFFILVLDYVVGNKTSHVYSETHRQVNE